MGYNVDTFRNTEVMTEVSHGRGGAGNIGDIGSQSTQRKDRDVIPDSAVRSSTDAHYHTGRGGAGNEHSSHKKKTEPKHNGTAEASAPVSLADKLKGKLMGALKK